MTVHSTSATDKGIGISVLFVVLAALGALAMYGGAPQLTAAWGFAGAVLFGSLAIVALHFYE